MAPVLNIAAYGITRDCVHLDHKMIGSGLVAAKHPERGGAGEGLFRLAGAERSIDDILTASASGQGRIDIILLALGKRGSSRFV